ncbi:MAG: xanthine dehydrogenase family protein subunit M, partial [Alphaproteobacteria bacterium]|nr:xanthine dehydrogenase family protein subunit M [Alphaproteobacteria bacterium]
LGIGFEEVAVRRGDFAILAAAVEVQLDADGTCQRAACGLAGAAPVPFRAEAVEAALVGGSLDDDAITRAVIQVAPQLAPASDLHASAAYRRRLAPALLDRVIRAARDDALGHAR